LRRINLACTPPANYKEKGAATGGKPSTPRKFQQIVVIIIKKSTDCVGKNQDAP
jgi:hypothetical protein